MLKTGLFAGAFDPFTMGHYEIAERASRLLDKLYIGVAEATGAKNCLLPPEERAEITRRSVARLGNVTVDSFGGFLVDYAGRLGVDVIVRGLRTSNDFEYEKALAEVYKSQNPKIETLFLISSHEYAHISGTTVRELAALGGDVTGYVYPAAVDLVKNHYKRRK